MEKTLKVTFYFPADSSNKPYINEMVRAYNISFSILSADIVPGKRGRTLLQLWGEEDEINKAIGFMKGEGVGVRIFTDEIIHDRGRCVDCGACTAVCPSGALYMMDDTLNFDAEKCVACEHCIGACPTRAIGHEVFS